MIGQTVSHYSILDRRGSGGMGIVCRARDAVLGRNVALNSSPPDFTGDRQTLGRFQREARAPVALNHPNICTLHELVEQEGQPFIVTELPRGETLKHRIEGKPLEMDRLLDLAIQITDALTARWEETRSPLPCCAVPWRPVTPIGIDPARIPN